MRTGYPSRKAFGAIAQLEERLVCIQKARGSSPLSSTGQRPNAILKAAKQSQTKSQSRRTIRRMTATARRGHAARIDGAANAPGHADQDVYLKALLATGSVDH